MLGWFWSPLFVLDLVWISLTLGFLTVRVGISIRKREWLSSLLSAAGAVCLAGTSWFWWLREDEFRGVIVASVLVGSVVAVIPSHRWRLKLRFMRTFLTGWVVFIDGGFALVVNTPPFGMVWTPVETVQTPGYRYAASVLNAEGIVYGYDCLVLRPTGFDWSTLLDYPHQDVAEFATEGDITAMEWNSPTLLTVRIRPKTEFMRKRTSLNGVHIRYVVDATAEPSIINSD